MALTRRELMAQTAAISAMGALPSLAHAKLSLGAIRLDVVSDGFLTLPGDFIFGPMPQDELPTILSAFDQSSETLTPPCNVTLMRTNDRIVLFDLGSGTEFSPNSGILPDSLEGLGVGPEDVTDVIFTHAHPDHLWGLLDDFEDPMFPNASYMIGRAEWDYWMNPNTVDDIGEAMTAFAVGAQRRLAMLEDDIAFIDDGQEILPGVAARATFGHTPGHMSFEVRDGANAAMIIGDCIGNHHVAFARPDWPSGSDQDRETAIQTRISLLDQLNATQMPLIGYHLPGGLGRVEKSDGAYQFVSEV